MCSTTCSRYLLSSSKGNHLLALLFPVCCVRLHCYLHFISSLIELQDIDLALILQDLSKNNNRILARLPKQRKAYQRASGGLQSSAAKFSKALFIRVRKHQDSHAMPRNPELSSPHNKYHSSTCTNARPSEPSQITIGE